MAGALGEVAAMKYITTINEQEYEVEIFDDKHVTVNGQCYEMDFHSLSDQPVYSLLVDGKSYEAYVYPAEESWQVLLVGRQFDATVEDERERRLKIRSEGGVSERAEFLLKAPMPGLIVSVPVQEGQTVEKGEILVVLESMKMQNELKSPRAGTVSRLRVHPGDSVELRQVLLSIV
jgi:biotin carboxyl carrier protein